MSAEPDDVTDQASNISPDSPAASASPRRNDRISPLVLLLLVVCIILQSSWLPKLAALLPHNTRARIAEVTGPAGPSSDIIQDTMLVDSSAKAYYGFSSALSAAVTQQKLPKKDSGLPTLQSALKTAEKYLEKYPRQPALAIRVILLRAEIGNENPLQAWTGVQGYKIYSPLDAFNVSKEYAPQTQSAYKRERDGFQVLYSTAGRLTPSQAETVRSDFRAGTDLKWWQTVLNHQIDLRTGNLRQAAVDLADIRHEAAASVVGISAVVGFLIVAVLAGMAALVTIAVSAFGNVDMKGWVTSQVPSVVADEYRRLGAGDLTNLFVLYLLVMVGASLLAAQFQGSIQKYTRTLSWRGAVTASIVLEAAALGLCGIIIIAAAAWLAKKRGAKLSYEIGLNFGWERAGITILFGILGWGASMAILLPVSGLASEIFRNAPAPANPAIPLMLASPAGFAAIMMYVTVAVIAPITEELVFRGFLLNALKIKYGAARGVVFTGLAFGLIHPVGIAEQIGLCTLGMTLAFIAHWKKSLFPSMIAHALQNSFVYSALLLSTISSVRPSLH